ncbi:hypothetical protein DXA96_15845 [Lachnospiraceae bacterium OF09-33XD]|nr:hypothetical protein DXA96_15845 [Lachnospiraceae bacterium OF09-33XD]
MTDFCNRRSREPEAGVFYYKSPGRQPGLGHACMHRSTGIERARKYEQAGRQESKVLLYNMADAIIIW